MSTLLNEALASATETKALLTHRGCLVTVGDEVARRFPGRRVVLIAASDTWSAAGAAVAASLAQAGVAADPPHTFAVPPFLHADSRWVEALRPVLAGGALPVVVGSGTVNDLVKRAAFEAGTPYLCVATAASVDGYTSSGAALLKDGFKQTLPCPAPAVVVADPAVLEAAPEYLTSSGYGDLASKLIAGADWLLADAAGADPIDAFTFRLTQGELRQTLAAATPLRLFEGLAITGFAMQYLKSSRPVSGGEHLFSHIWEMEDLSVGGRPVTHGHKVALGTLAMTALYEVLLDRGTEWLKRKPRLPTEEERRVQVEAAFAGSPVAPGAAHAAVAVSLAKRDPGVAALRRERIADAWPTLTARLRAQLVPYAELRDAFAAAGCPVTSGAVGLDRTTALATAHRAQMIRDRYGLLDLLFDLGALDEAVDAVLAEPTYLA